MLVNLSLGITGILFFLFIFWERLNEDYSSEVIFQTAFSILIGMALGIIVSKIFIPGWFFWLSVVGSMLGLSLLVYKFKLRFYETFEAFLLASMPFVALMFINDSVKHSSLYSFLAFVAVLILIFLAYWLDLNYKNFNWYKSGRIGFAGISAAIIFFIVRDIIAILGINMISFADRFEIIFSGISTILLLAVLVNLGKSRS